ncbi:MAG: O-antigen ligase family protein [Phycisphaerales bacterium]
MTSNPNMMLAYAFAGLLGLAVAVVLATRPRTAIWIIGAMLLASMLGVVKETMFEYRSTLLLPIQSRRSEIVLVCGVLLFASALVYFARRGVSRISGPIGVLLIIGFYAATLRIVHSGPVDGLFSIAFVIATLLSLAVVIPPLLDDVDDWCTMFRIWMIANAIWIGGVALQFVVNRSMLVVAGNRFLGLTGNPQHAAVALSVLVVVAIWLALNDPKRRYWPLWVGLAAIDLTLLAWTGSRTGMLMLAAGSSIVLWSRVGKAVLFLPALAAAMLIVWQFVTVSNIEMGLDRLVSTDNTRANAWAKLWSIGWTSPVFGVGAEEAGDSENSILLGFAAYGIFMVVLVFMLFGAMAFQWFQLLAARRSLGDAAPFADLALAYPPMYFIGSMFEGFVVARVNVHIILLIVFSSIAGALIRYARSGAALADWDDAIDDPAADSWPGLAAPHGSPA